MYIQPLRRRERRNIALSHRLGNLIRPPHAVPRSKNAGAYLRIDSASAPVYDRVKNLLSIFSPENGGTGRDAVYFYVKDTGKYNVAAHALWVDYNPVLERELKKLLGAENVVYKQ